MANLDPQVQIRAMELAITWSNHADVPQNQTPEAYTKIKAERFDQAYKAIIKTLNEAHANPLQIG
jgi:hypothetical protein